MKKNVQRQKRSLAIPIAIGLVTVISLLLGTFVALHIASERKSMLLQLEDELAITTSQLATGLALPVWNVDHDHIDKVVESAMVDHNIYGIAVNESAKLPGDPAIHAIVRDENWQAKPADQDIEANNFLVKEMPILYSGQQIGTVKVLITPQFKEQALRRELFLFTFAILVIDFLLILGLYLQVWYLVLKPLKAVERYAAAVSSEDKENPLAVVTHLPGELGSLGESITKMVALLGERYQELQVSEEKHRGLTENLPQRIFHKDQDLVYISCNRRFAEDLKITPIEIEGKTDFDYFPKELAEKYRADDKRVMESGEVEEIEETYIRDGKEVYVQTVKTPLTDDAGSVIGILGIFWDITERKLAEGALQKSEERYRSLYLNTPVMLHSIDPEGRLISVSNHWVSQMGYSHEEVLGRRSTEFLTDESRKYAIEVVIPDFLKTGSCIDVPYQFVKKSGEIIDVLLSGIVEKNLAGKIIRSMAVMVDVTAQQQAEKALHESEREKRSLLEDSPVCNKIIDMDSNLQYMSSAGIAQLKIQDITPYYGKTYPPEIYPEVMRAPLVKGLNLAKSGMMNDVECPVHDIQGNVVWYHTTFVPVFGDDGPVKHVIGTSVNITERKQAEKSLRDSEEKHRSIFETTNDAITIIMDGVFVDCNPKALDLFGCKRDQLIGRTPGEFSPETQPNMHNSEEKSREVIELALAGKPQFFEWQHTRLDGTPFDTEISLSSFEFGDEMRIIASLREVTYRKIAENLLSESQERLQKFYDAAFEGIVIVEGGKIIDFNDRLTQIIGYTRDELQGMQISNVVHSDYFDTVKENIESGRTDPYVTRLIHKDGSIKDVEVCGEYITLEGRRVRVTTINDVTETMLVQKELLEHQNRLRELSTQLTLAEEQERRRLATKLHDGVGHSLALARMKLDDLLELQPKKEIGTAIAELHSLLSTTIENTRDLTFQISPPMLHELGLLPALKWLADRTMEKHGVDVLVTPATLSANFSQDLRVLLFQSAREILFNAIKHAHASKISVELKLIAEGIQLSIADDGAGFNVSDAQEKRGKAGGLGLFSINERMRYVGGKLDVHSTSGQGTKVTLYAPLITQEVGSAVASQLTPPTRAEISQARASDIPIRIVIADDHRLIRQGLSSMLSAEPNIEIIGEAETGVEAISMALHRVPDIIVMDIDMPELDGIQATQQIKRDLPEIHIIALSMHEESHFISEMLQAGASGYLLKDCAEADLVVAINAVRSNLTFLSQRITELVIAEFINNSAGKKKPAISVLTSRELEILKLVISGEQSKSIAIELDISLRTVEAHRHNIKQKLGVDSLPELTKLAIEEGLIQ